MSAPNSEKLKDVEPVKKEPEQVKKDEPILKHAGQFWVYQCKQCMAMVPDAMVHTIQDQHTKGYIATLIIIEAEATPEELEAEKKKDAADAKAAAISVISGKKPVKANA